MKRWFLNILAIFSLLLFVAALALWVRSYWQNELFEYGNSRGSTFLWTSCGQLRLEHNVPLSGVELTTPFEFHYWVDKPAVKFERVPGTNVYFWNVFGFSLVTGERWGDYHYALFVPFWFVAVLSAVLTLWGTYHWRRVRRQYRQQAGLCVNCGYDLRASKDRCPECGTPTLSRTGRQE